MGRFLADHRDKPSCDSPCRTWNQGPKAESQHRARTFGGIKFEVSRRNLIYDMKSFAGYTYAFVSR